MDIIRARLKVAEVLAQSYEMQNRSLKASRFQRSSGNVFADLWTA